MSIKTNENNLSYNYENNNNPINDNIKYKLPKFLFQTAFKF